jgi:hypothetical protein
MTTKNLNAGWYLTKVSHAAHYFEPWEANDFFSASRCGQLALASSLWKNKQIRHCKTCERITTKRNEPMKYLDPEKPLARRLRSDPHIDQSGYHRAWRRAGKQIDAAIKSRKLQRNEL